MGLTFEQAIARVPFLAKAKDIKTTPLGGGITNLNYKIDCDGKSYVLRITGADTELLGIRRDVEHAGKPGGWQAGHCSRSGILHRAGRLPADPLCQRQTHPTRGDHTAG